MVTFQPWRIQGSLQRQHSYVSMLEVPRHSDVQAATKHSVYAMCFLVPCYTKSVHLHLLEGRAQVLCHGIAQKMELCQDTGHSYVQCWLCNDLPRMRDQNYSPYFKKNGIFLFIAAAACVWSAMFSSSLARVMLYYCVLLLALLSNTELQPLFLSVIRRIIC